MVFANNEPLSGHLWYLMAYALRSYSNCHIYLKG